MTNHSLNSPKVKALISSLASGDSLTVAAQFAGLAMSEARQLARRRSFGMLVEATRHSWMADILRGIARRTKLAAMKAEVAALKRELARRKVSPKKASRQPK
jgi:hypothetical protein